MLKQIINSHINRCHIHHIPSMINKLLVPEIMALRGSFFPEAAGGDIVENYFSVSSSFSCFFYELFILLVSS